MTKREKQIIQCLSENPFISQQELADALGIQRSSVAVQLSNLMNKGIIKGKGYILSQRPEVVVIGGSNMDLSGFSNESIQLEDSNPGQIKLSVGGVGQNIAQNLVKIGLSTTLISVVGDDIYGKKILQSCEASGIDISHTQVEKEMSTAIYLSILDSNGDMKVAIVDSDIHQNISPSLLTKKRNVIHSAQVIVIDTNLSVESIDMITHQFSDTPIFVDTVSSKKAVKIKAFLDKIHTIKPNRVEVEALTGIAIKDQKTLDEAMDCLLSKGLKQVFISMGAEGVYYGTHDKRGWSQFEIQDIINTNGAGDAYMAGIVYGYLQQISVEETLKYASAMAFYAMSSEETVNPEINIYQINEKVKEI